MDKEKPHPKKKNASTICRSRSKISDEINTIKPPPVNLKEAGLRIQNILMLNVWRSEKEKSKDQEDNAQKLKSHVNNLKIQIYALHQLLEAEKNRVSILYEEIHRLINNVEQCKQEKITIQKEKDELEATMKDLKNKFSELEGKWKNQKNELISAKSEAENWEKQLNKEREKLAKIKDERNAWLDEFNEEDAKNGMFSKNIRDPTLKNTFRNIKKPAGRSREDHIEKIDFSKKK